MQGHIPLPVFIFIFVIVSLPFNIFFFVQTNHSREGERGDKVGCDSHHEQGRRTPCCKYKHLSGVLKT